MTSPERKRINAQPLFVRSKDEAQVPAPAVLIAPEKRLKLHGGRHFDRDPKFNSGIYTIDGWRGTWVSLERVNDAIDCGIEIPEEGDPRVTNHARYHVIERGGHRYIGRTDSIVGLVTDEQYEQYLRDLAEATQEKMDAEAGTVTTKELTRPELADEVKLLEREAQVPLVPPPPA